MFQGSHARWQVQQAILLQDNVHYQADTFPWKLLPHEWNASKQEYLSREDKIEFVADYIGRMR